MKNENYICINSNTFEITKRDNIFVVSKKLSKVITILNKKGYYTELSDTAKLSKPFMISDIVHSLIEEEIIEVNDSTKDKLKKIINSVDYESTCIIFKDKYKFGSLPDGFKMINNDLYYNLKILKDSSNIEFKSLLELDRENDNSIRVLEEWADKLPINN